MTVETVAELPKPLAQLIKEIAKDNGYTDYNLHAKTLDTEGGNYMGSLYTVDIEKDGRELNLFAKLTNTPEQARGMVDSNQLYKREVFCYTDLADAFDAIESKHKMPEEQRHKFIKYYGSNLTDLEEVIVFENMSNKGYTMYDRLKSMDWEYAKLALDKLACYHALSFALEREEPELFEKLIKSKKNMAKSSEDRKNDEAAEAYLKSNLSMVLEAVGPELAPALQKFLATFSLDFFEKQHAAIENSVLTHGDYRISNILIKYEEGELKDLLPLDYQTVYYGSPVNDVLYLLVTGTDETFRRQHYEDFLQHYHDSLGRALASLSHDVDEVYPRSVFYAHVRERMLYALCVALFVMPLMLVTPGEQIRLEDIIAVDAKEGAGASSMNNAVYEERLRGIVRDMIRWGTLSL